MINYLKRISEDLVKINLEEYWPGFELVAFALYDNSNVYLFNHPKFNNQQYHVLKRDEQFNGCTLILYEDYPTAIVDLDLYDNYQELYSILVHELFHGFQYVRGENRFPDEMKGLTYPLSKENIELRNQERLNLYNALLEDNTVKKKQFLNAFVSLREQRLSKINDYLIYENLIETVEGPAWFVELKAYSEKSKVPYNSVAQKYGKSLIDKYESTANIRGGCYRSGLFMCLLLDQFCPGWKEQFLGSEETIYDLIKRLPDDNVKTPIGDIEISSETEDAINLTLKNRAKEFEGFYEQNGFHLVIIGEMSAKSFDPMNITPLEDRFLHKNFLGVRINDEEYLLQQPVITYCKDRLQNIKKLHLILENKPVENTNHLTIEGVGEIKGRFMKQGNTSCLFVKPLK